MWRRTNNKEMLKCLRRRAWHSSTLVWRISQTEEPGGLQTRVTKSRTRLKGLGTHARRAVKGAGSGLDRLGLCLGSVWTSVWLWVASFKRLVEGCLECSYFHCECQHDLVNTEPRGEYSDGRREPLSGMKPSSPAAGPAAGWCSSSWSPPGLPQCKARKTLASGVSGLPRLSNIQV